jgi:regulator of protease activity HflC (stomatin/prohibitin superfamily)
MNMSRVFAVVAAAGFLLSLALIGQLVQNVAADEVVVIQSPVSGSLTWFTTPGPKWQGFGKVTIYKKRSIYPFTVKMRFNDGAHGTLSGSIQYDLPVDASTLTSIHTKFGSQEAVQERLIQTIVDKSIYMTGPLMSSKESYAERRNALIAYVEDQVRNGVYQTKQTEDRVTDQVTGESRTVTKVEIVLGKDGNPLRQEESVLNQFGVVPSNFSITGLDYEDQVEKQIQTQQQATMDVQTAMANSRKAEQDALTIAKQGEAAAAKAKWEQEALKAQAVTQAEQEKAVAITKAEQEKAVAVTAGEQRKQVALLDAEAAEAYRVAQIKRADGDATYKKQVMAADGALAQKLDAYIKVNEKYADALSKFQGPLVPSVVMSSGNGSGPAGGSAADLINMLTVKTAKDIALDLSTKTAPDKQ